jgi:cysteine desulfurase
MSLIYLDHNATTPVDPRVAAAMQPWLADNFGNPSSAHAAGQAARRAVERARAQVAELLGCAPDEVVFTSGGTESDNHAILGTAYARRDRGRHLIVSAVEHPAVLEPCAWLASEGWGVTRLPVDDCGRVAPADLARAIDDETVLVSVMHANNEVGTIEPVRALADLAHARGAWVHCDAAQSLGKIPVRVDDLGVDLLTVAGHKVYAPKGVGALYVRRGTTLTPLLRGAGHEGGRRAGTEAVPAIVGLGEACALAAASLPAETARLAALRDQLAAALCSHFPEACIHARAAERLPNTLSIAFPGRSAPAILAMIGDELAASAGAACHGSGEVLSGVLAAMGVPLATARGTLRFSLGRSTTPAQIARAVEILIAAIGAATAG